MVRWEWRSIWSVNGGGNLGFGSLGLGEVVIEVLRFDRVKVYKNV